LLFCSVWRLPYDDHVVDSVGVPQALYAGQQ
jgi:hypothetical protein